jgi:hypothetical protein
MVKKCVEVVLVHFCPLFGLGVSTKEKTALAVSNV